MTDDWEGRGSLDFHVDDLLEDPLLEAHVVDLLVAFLVAPLHDDLVVEQLQQVLAELVVGGEDDLRGGGSTSSMQMSSSSLKVRWEFSLSSSPMFLSAFWARNFTMCFWFLLRLCQTYMSDSSVVSLFSFLKERCRSSSM